MKKKSNLIYVLVGVVIVLGFAISRFVGWPVDSDNASGDIAKSSHFSRKTADAGANNMQEFLQNDEDFKNGVVTAYMVMKTRAEQFNALVDMSAEVAGSIKEFEPLLKEMKEAKPLINNVCATMDTAGNDLNSALGGEDANDLEQNTANAALAYNSLQKQNKLADQFIELADKNQKVDNDRLKFVRDQWVDYQKMTASLNKDDKLAQELEKKGYLLSEEKFAAALGAFNELQQISTLRNASLAKMFGVDIALSNNFDDVVMSCRQIFFAHEKMNAQQQMKAHQDLNAQQQMKAHQELNAQHEIIANTDAQLNERIQARKILWNSGSMLELHNLQSSFQDKTMNLTNEALGQMPQINQFIIALSSNDLNAVRQINE